MMNIIRTFINQSLISLAVLSISAVFVQPSTAETIAVTRRYPKLIYNNAFELWKTYNQERQQGDDGKGFLAAYLADKYLLGQGQDGWKRVQQTYQKSDRLQYFADLRKFLRETGYTK
ncbi:hypothetical protein [Atlanticothrix silvestris]|uniref:hypothetical protein n=1 Tax=Atlanticothrix silvestris TaxID=2840444 RepID=UPI001CEC744A|nr:hypothetical protein [Atlanticothrix silvestris]